MDKKFTNVLISLVVVLALFAVVMFVLGAKEPAEGALFNFSVDQASVVSRFVFVVIGIAIAFAVYFATQGTKPGKLARAKSCGWPSARRCMRCSPGCSTAPFLLCLR